VQPPRNIPFGKPVFSNEEREAVLRVLDSGMLVHGREIEEFETAFAAFTGAPHAVGTSSCTAALHLCYLALGIGSGDEVIVPAMTHVATAHAVALTGARPVFVDAETEHGNVRLDRLRQALSPATKALSVVHFLGMPVDMHQVMAFARSHNLFVIEDCALAPGATIDETHVGLFGDAGCFSFYPVKHITTAEGGMVITRHEDLAGDLRLRRAFGVDRHVGERTLPGLYDVVLLGYNYRMSEIAATLGREQLRRLPDFLARRTANFDTLNAGVTDLPGAKALPRGSEIGRNACYAFTILLDPDCHPDRAALINELRARGVGTSIYYPHPVPRLKYYADNFGYRAGDFPGAEFIADRSITLPVGPHIDDDDARYIVGTVRDVLGGAAA